MTALTDGRPRVDQVSRLHLLQDISPCLHASRAVWHLGVDGGVISDEPCVALAHAFDLPIVVVEFFGNFAMFDNGAGRRSEAAVAKHEHGVKKRDLMGWRWVRF